MPPLETISMSVDIISATEFPGEPMAQMDQREIRKQQLGDSFLGFWVRAVRKKNSLKELSLKLERTLQCLRSLVVSSL